MLNTIGPLIGLGSRKVEVSDTWAVGAEDRVCTEASEAGTRPPEDDEAVDWPEAKTLSKADTVVGWLAAADLTEAAALSTADDGVGCVEAAETDVWIDGPEACQL